MGSLVGRLAPTLAMLCLTGYCCWLGSAEPAAAKHGGRVPVLAGSLLTSAAAPEPARDPFGLRRAAPPAPPAAPKPPPPPPPPPAQAKKAPPKEKPARPRPTPAALAALARGLTLKAVCASAGGGTALINGQFYRPGDAVKGAGAGGGALVVARVDADRVLLRHEDQQVELKFPEAAAKSARKAPARPVPKRPSPRAPARAGR
jgi:hypothetical protein